MQLSISNADFETLNKIIEICRPEGYALRQLLNYGERFFTTDGKRKCVHTGFPEEIYVATEEGCVLGYIHFFVDCWEEYETTILSKGLATSLSPERGRDILEQLQKELDLREP